MEMEYGPDRWVAYRACMLLLLEKKKDDFFSTTLHTTSSLYRLVVAIVADCPDPDDPADLPFRF